MPADRSCHQCTGDPDSAPAPEPDAEPADPKTTPSLAHRAPSQPTLEKFDATCCPKKIPLIVAFLCLQRFWRSGLGAGGVK